MPERILSIRDRSVGNALEGRLSTPRGVTRQDSMLTVKNFVHSHTVGVPIAAKTDYNKALFFGHYGLINMPACDKMRENDRAHVDCVLLMSVIAPQLEQ